VCSESRYETLRFYIYLPREGHDITPSPSPEHVPSPYNHALLCFNPDLDTPWVSVSYLSGATFPAWLARLNAAHPQYPAMLQSLTRLEVREWHASLTSRHFWRDLSACQLAVRCLPAWQTLVVEICAVEPRHALRQRRGLFELLLEEF
jgi:hypothetical protein